MSSELVLRLLYDIAYARIVFFREPRNPVDIRSFLSNEGTMLRIAQNSIATSLTALLLTAPSTSFLEPVVVSLTVPQIESATQSIDVPENTQEICCICQDSLAAAPSCSIRQCSHKLHRTCANQWFSMSVRCPVCRVDLRESRQNTNNNGRT